VEQTTLDQLRRRLDDERSGLVAQLVDMGVDPTTGVPNDGLFEQGFADSGQATAEKARMLSITEGMLETLREIDAAIGRMDKGTYGRCESCGAEIPAERLDARPVASLCVACKQRNS
jgi:RNA polymerase-binding protein DksA